MNRKQPLLLILAFFSLSLLSACAIQPMRSAPPFDAQPIQGTWETKADHLVFILDASSSMAKPHADLEKFETAKGIVAHFNQTMPDLYIQVILRGFGLAASVSSKSTEIFYGPQAYSRNGLADGLKKISSPGGPSPMAKALKAAGADLSESHGPIAMVIISDGENLGNEPLAAAADLAVQFSDRLCIYTVLLGEDNDGRILLEKMAATTNCGQFTTAENLGTGAGMSAFVKDVLLTGEVDSDGDGVPDSKDSCPDTPRDIQVDAQGCPFDSDGDGVYDYKDKCPDTPRDIQVDAQGCPFDSDGDGVYDYKDKCPDTPRNTKVDAQGCPFPIATKSAEVTKSGTWIYRKIQFETNKANLKPSSYPVLDEIVAGLKAQPSIKVEIQGHTDSTGTAEYNQTLSEKRAQSVRNYLVNKGIVKNRLISKGYGLNSPISTNKTVEGRALNRRVELKPIQ
ncbi:MAG: OmpA family protein [Desulfobacterales bacterium]|nr:OmpA family protein [Desulfobacterales bacterium]MDD4073346.1 OmpA family protein [Desulfobacterales bacterium]MDD4391840.1 OmpA family protein [Desulfobacterales bacterium]